MSSKNLKFIDRLRSKSFDKAIITGNNLATYNYIENFDNITEEECLRVDSQNKDIYKKNMDLYGQISKQIENKNAMFKIDSPPLPPTEPNNYDRFIACRLRNVSRNVRYQSYAIQYLLNKGYKLIFEQKEKVEKGEIEFESYEAIDICEKIENMSIDNLLKRDFPTASQIAQYNRKSLHISNVMPPGYVPVYPPEHYLYAHNGQHNIPSQTSLYNNYPYLSQNLTPATASTITTSSNIAVTIPTVPQLPPPPQLIKSTLISGPPAAHYIHNNN